MGTYFNPPSDLPKVARRLHGLDWEGAQRQLKSDEVLFGLGDRLVFKNAPYLFSKEEYQAFYDVYASGHFVTFELYAMPVATFEQHFGYNPKGKAIP